MGVEIRPEPTPEEREALLAALSRLDGKPNAASAWWEAGIREAVEEPGAVSELEGDSPTGRSAAG
jgi:hypothetical protein